MMEFLDMNEVAIRMNDVIRPIEGRDLLIVGIGYHSELGEVVLYGQQILEPSAFSILTADNLALQWSVVTS